MPISCTKIDESGYVAAMTGLALSYGTTPNPSKRVDIKLAKKDGGHNKFLESIVVWFSLDLPRYLWQQFDAYRVGITKQSESTMHTLLRRGLAQEDFVEPIFQPTLKRLNALIEKKNFKQIKIELPEGFLQTRIVSLNYKVLRNMILQRKDHKLDEWRGLLNMMVDAVEHPDLLPEVGEPKPTTMLCRKSTTKGHVWIVEENAP